MPNNEWAQFPLLRGHPADEVEDFSLIGKRRPGPWWSYLLVIALLAGAIRLIIVLSDAFGTAIGVIVALIAAAALSVAARVRLRHVRRRSSH